MKPRTVDRVEDTEIHQGMNARHRVREVLPHGRFEEHDPFLMLAEDWFVAGTFGDHPHRGFETFTFILEGEVIHRDNHGGHGVLKAGDAQWMTAGRGVIHSEEAGPDGAHSLQLWINLPARLKMTEPSYHDLRGDAMPVRAEPGVVLREFRPERNLASITIVELRIDAGASATQPLPPDNHTFIYIISGSGRFGADATPARAGQVVWLASDGDEVTIRAEENLHAILFSGPPISERVAARGPFVMNTYEEIHQAILDFQTGKF
jgi:redox-sensitive bicupin YhaK (pirin superfamily)